LWTWPAPPARAPDRFDGGPHAISTFLGAGEDLLRNIYRVAKVAAFTAIEAGLEYMIGGPHSRRQDADVTRI
jgi:hypothetical protein